MRNKYRQKECIYSIKCPCPKVLDIIALLTTLKECLNALASIIKIEELSTI